MPVPRMKPNSAATKAKSPANTTAAAIASKKQELSEAKSPFAIGKPDRNEHDAEQDRLKSEIDSLQIKLSVVKEKISVATKPTQGNERRIALRAELDGIHFQHQDLKNSRQKILGQLKSIQEGIQKKIKDLQAAKSKVPFKTVEEVDDRIKNLDAQINTGKMKLADEKRALQEIQNSKRQRRSVQNFQAEQEAIDADRAAIDQLRRQLDDPDSKAVTERYERIKAELEEVKKEDDEVYASRSKLFEERDSLQAELNSVFSKKRELVHQFREQNDRYRAKINEDRARRAERARQLRAAEEAKKKQEIAQRILEEATVPAFLTEIEDCQTLIEYFSGKTPGNTAQVTSAPSSRSELEGVPRLEIRQVDGPPEGSTVRIKKKDEDDDYFVGGKVKSKSRKRGGAAPSKQGTDGNGSSSPPLGSNSQLNVPFPTLRALMTHSIPVPTSTADVPQLIENLKTKKAWYEANQKRVTAENVARAESDIQRLTQSAGVGRGTTPVVDADVATSNLDADDDEGLAASVPTAAADNAEWSAAVAGTFANGWGAENGENGENGGLVAEN